MPRTCMCGCHCHAARPGQHRAGPLIAHLGVQARRLIKLALLHQQPRQALADWAVLARWLAVARVTRRLPGVRLHTCMVAIRKKRRCVLVSGPWIPAAAGPGSMQRCMHACGTRLLHDGGGARQVALEQRQPRLTLQRRQACAAARKHTRMAAARKHTIIVAAASLVGCGLLVGLPHAQWGGTCAACTG